MIKAKPKTRISKPRRKKKRVGPALEKLAQEMGVSVSTVWRWENEGIPGSGPLKDWREQHLKAALKKLGESARAA